MLHEGNFTLNVKNGFGQCSLLMQHYLIQINMCAFILGSGAPTWTVLGSNSRDQKTEATKAFGGVQQPGRIWIWKVCYFIKGLREACTCRTWIIFPVTTAILAS